MAESHCGEAHGVVVTRLDRAEADICTLRGEHDKHCANGGTGHITRGEFDALRSRTADNEKAITDMRTMAIRAFIGVLIAASGGSALAPALKAVALALVGKL